MPWLEVGAGPNTVEDEFWSTVSGESPRVSGVELEAISESPFDATGKGAPQCVGVFVL